MNYYEYLEQLLKFDWVYFMNNNLAYVKRSEERKAELKAFADSDEVASKMYHQCLANVSDRFDRKEEVTPMPTVEDVKQWLMQTKIAA